MQDLTRAQKARMAVQSFKTLAHAIALRGFYRPSGKLGRALADCLINLSPEIYGSMVDPRIVELKGLEYVIDRLPRGIETCTRIILTEEEQFGGTTFEEVIPLKRRRLCYRISQKEICFVITRGLSEIYDILTHLTFMYHEARKIRKRMKDESGNTTIEWGELKRTVDNYADLTKKELDQAAWNLSIILGRPYHQTRNSCKYFERSIETGEKEKANGGNLFSLIYHLGKRIEEEEKARENVLIVYLTPSLMNIIGHQRYGAIWADDIKQRLKSLNLDERPLHIISANLHSVANLFYAYAALESMQPETDLYDFIFRIREKNQGRLIMDYAADNGLYELPDRSGAHLNCQIIDTASLESVVFHPEINIDRERLLKEKPVLLVMDYAFGAQAFEVMDNLLTPYSEEDPVKRMNVSSVSIMGKAGILPGSKGDIMLATAHVIEGSSDNYIFDNDLEREDFPEYATVFIGPMITVVGTSLQNRPMLQKFQKSWNTVGLEMEGGHYHRAISAAMIKGHIRQEVKVRYAYYASDNPIISGQTLAAGEMGDEGVRPTYLVTKVILEKIFR